MDYAQAIFKGTFPPDMDKKHYRQLQLLRRRWERSSAAYENDGASLLVAGRGEVAELILQSFGTDSFEYSTLEPELRDQPSYFYGHSGVLHSSTRHAGVAGPRVQPIGPH